MFGEDWCDMNSDDDLGLDGIPELPPLMPLDDFPEAPVTPEKSGGTHEESSTTSAGGSAPENDDVECSPKAEPRTAPVNTRFRFEGFTKKEPSPNPDTPKVC